MARHLPEVQMGFFDALNATDPTYILLRGSDWPQAIRARAHIERIWVAAGPYLDNDLVEKASHSLHPHYWELLIAAGLLAEGLNLAQRTKRRHGDMGPDILCEGPRCWIEAIAPTGGEGPDAVDHPTLGVVSWVPHADIKLRLASALAKKLGVYASYIAEDLVSPADPFVVAINGGGIPSGRHEMTVPRIVSTLFPLGDEYISLDRSTLNVVGGGFHYTPIVLKRSGSEVRMDPFLSPVYSPISAVLYSAVDALNFPIARLADAFMVVHNPLATNPLQRGALPCHREYWADLATSTVHFKS